MPEFSSLSDLAIAHVLGILFSETLLKNWKVQAISSPHISLHQLHSLRLLNRLVGFVIDSSVEAIYACSTGSRLLSLTPRGWRRFPRLRIVESPLWILDSTAANCAVEAVTAATRLTALSFPAGTDGKDTSDASDDRKHDDSIVSSRIKISWNGSLNPSERGFGNKTAAHKRVLGLAKAVLRAFVSVCLSSMNLIDVIDAEYALRCYLAALYEEWSMPEVPTEVSKWPTNNMHLLVTMLHALSLSLSGLLERASAALPDELSESAAAKETAPAEGRNSRISGVFDSDSKDDDSATFNALEYRIIALLEEDRRKNRCSAIARDGDDDVSQGRCLLDHLSWWLPHHFSGEDDQPITQEQIRCLVRQYLFCQAIEAEPSRGCTGFLGPSFKLPWADRVVALDLSGRAEVTDQDLGRFGRFCVRLQRLALRNCSGLGALHEFIFAENCLEHLELEGCWQLTDDAVARVTSLRRPGFSLDLTEVFPYPFIAEDRGGAECSGAESVAGIVSIGERSSHRRERDCHRAEVEVVILESGLFRGKWVDAHLVRTYEQQRSSNQLGVVQETRWDIHVEKTSRFHGAVGFSDGPAVGIRRQHLRQWLKSL